MTALATLWKFQDSIFIHQMHFYSLDAAKVNYACNTIWSDFNVSTSAIALCYAK